MDNPQIRIPAIMALIIAIVSLSYFTMQNPDHVIDYLVIGLSIGAAAYLMRWTDVLNKQKRRK